MPEDEEAARSFEGADETESKDKSDGDERYKTYLKERDAHIDAARESARTFDKAVLTFGSAVFGFSVAFLKDVAPHPAPATLKWLGLAWCLFALGLLAILLSFLFSHRACMFEVECSDNRYAHPGCKPKKNRWSIITHWCNFVCIACLFAGLLTWATFAYKNLG